MSHSDIGYESNASAPVHQRTAAALTVTALGLVYGDIGTSPLYALQLTMKALGHVVPSAGDALGIVSLICWSLLITVGIKYCLIVLRADNQGEGGILALSSLIADGNNQRRRIYGIGAVTLLGIAGSALLFGDGVITPAISVLAAMEGIEVLAPQVEHLVVPAAIALLLVLFLAQRFGSGKIGGAFGPVMVAWFAVIALIGIYRIVEEPRVLMALSPFYAYEVLVNNPATAFAVFGAVFLAVTGGEAMYADMGHVGASAIRRAFWLVVLPGLLLNYFGQAAMIMVDPAAAGNPFYKAAPPWALAPLIVLAAAATIIASQALISGVFSLTRQAIQLDLLPKMRVSQTSHHEIGQIYVPVMNWLLACGTIAVVLSFRSADALGAAYGVAVSGTMLITTILLAKLMVSKWSCSWLCGGVTLLFFGTIDLGFFVSNSAKVAEGGWLPLAIAAVMAFLMFSWRKSTMAVRAELFKLSTPLTTFWEKLNDDNIVRVPGLAAWLTKVDDAIGPLLQRHVKHNKSLHEHVLLFTVKTARVPVVKGTSRLEFEVLGHGFYRLIFHVGFMQTAKVHGAICAEFRALARQGIVPPGLEDDLHMFIAQESLQRKKQGAAVNWLSWSVYVVMRKFAARTTDFFRLPREDVEERVIFLEV